LHAAFIELSMIRLGMVWPGMLNPTVQKSCLTCSETPDAFKALGWRNEPAPLGLSFLELADMSVQDGNHCDTRLMRAG